MEILKTLLFTTVICVMIFLFAMFVSAEMTPSQPPHADTPPTKDITKRGSGSIGLAYSQIIDDTSLGLTGEYEYDANRFDFEIDGQLQTGDLYRGTAYAEIVFDISAVDLKLETDITSKGYTLGTLGYEQKNAVSGTIKWKSMNIDIGFFNKNSGPWTRPNALDELVSKGYDEDMLSALGLSEIHPARKGVQFHKGNAYGVLVSTGFDWKRIEADVDALIELFGRVDKVHQVRTSFETSRSLPAGLSLNLELELLTQFYKRSITYETAFFTTINYPF